MSAPNLTVRRAVLEEANVIAQILRAAFLPYETQYIPAAFSATTPTAEVITQRWAEGPVWVVTQAQTLIGTVAAVPKTYGLYVRSMAVLPAARGLGAGQLLLEHVERFAREHNFPLMYLSTTPFLFNAIRLYEKFGFRPTKDGPHDLFGTPLFTMTKEL